MIVHKCVLSIAICLSLIASASASETVVKIGVLTDISGPLSDYSGMGAVEAAKMAAEDFGGKVLNKPIEIVYGDHLNKADQAMLTLRRWYDNDGVDAVMELGNSAVALAAQELTQQKNKVSMTTGAASTALYGAKCTPNSVDFAQDNYMYSRVAVKRALDEGAKTWFLLVTDYSFGHQLQELITNVITSNGGRVVGVARHPFNTSDFSSYLLAAQSSKADAIAFVNSLGDMNNSVKQAREFGIDKTMRLIAPAFSEPTARALGFKEAQGITFSTIMYWDISPETREFAKRFFARTKVMPTSGHYLNYSSVTHFLKAVAAAGTNTDGAAVVRKMKELPVDDFAIHGKVREDGRLMVDVYLAQVKKPSEAKDQWDLYNVLHKVPADEAFPPISAGGCPFVAKK